MATIAVTRELPGPALARLAAAHDVTVWPGAEPPSASELRALVAGADGLLSLLTDRVDRELLAAAPHLRAVANYAVGFDNVDVTALRERGIALGVTPDVLTDATADLTLALLLTVARRIPQAAAAVRTGDWRTWEPRGWLGLELAGSTLAVVGPGRIGTAVARRARAFGMTIVDVGRDDALFDALGRADVVTLHCPLTPATRRLIDAEAIEAMRPGVLLVNTARGGLVDQVALRAALQTGRLGGAGLDVTDPEPPAADDPLLDAPNLVVLPHIGSATHRARERMADIAVDNLLAALAGEAMPHPAPTG